MEAERRGRLICDLFCASNQALSWEETSEQVGTEGTFDCATGNGSKRGGAGSRKENPSSSPTGPGCARAGGEDEKSGVTGDCHAPFRGSPGVKLPGATALCLR